MAKLLKKLNKSENHTAFSLFTSIFSIFLCIVCFAGSTLAWLTADQSSETHTFESANSFVDSITIKQEVIMVTTELVENEDGELYEVMHYSKELVNKPSTTSDGVTAFSTSGGSRHVISYCLGGTAKQKLLVVEFENGRAYYTTSKGGTFDIVTPSDSVVYIYASWGKKIPNATKFIMGETIGGGEYTTETPETEEQPEENNTESQQPETEEQSEGELQPEPEPEPQPSEPEISEPLDEQ